MGIGRKAKQQSLTNTKLVGMRVQTSLNGKSITIVYGAQRISANLIGYDDFTPVSQQQQQGGKGVVGGGGKGSAKSFVYYAAIQAALCAGPIQGLRHVWDSQGALTLLTTTDTFTVPGGGGTHTVVPPSGGTHVFDHGPSRGDAYSVGPFTDYGSSGPVTLSGTQQFPMFKVSSAPATGQYSVNVGTGAYTFAAGDVGKVMTITYTYSVPDSSSNGQPLTKLSLTLFPGNRPQSPWAYMVSKHPAKALGYNGLAYVANSSLFLGSSGQLPNLTYEVLGFLPFGAGVMDANPAAIIPDMLTNAVYGAGFPSGLLGDFTQYSNYCVANGLFLSVALDQTETSAAIIQRLMDITNSECVWNGLVLKVVPYGDTTVVGNGVTFSPNTTPLYDLNDDDFISPDQGEPVQLKIGSAIDAKNSVWVEFLDRSNNYNVSIVPAKDDGSINLIGLRNDPPHSWHEITTKTVAALAADSLLRRKVYVRNVYTFTVGWRYAMLEPMDMVTITDANLGLNKAPVRIIDISEDDKGNLQINAEEFPWGTASPTLYPKEDNAGFQPASVVDPGSVNAPIIAEVNNRVTGQVGNQIWFGVSGQSVANWGGCHVWMSLDNATYKQIKDIYGNDKIAGPARMGLLTASFPSHADPDTVDTLTVDLAQSGGVLLSGTAADADGDRTLCMVDNELISYQTATLVSGNKYNLTTRIRRGQLGSTIASHAINAPFLRLDDDVFKYQFDPLLIGQTVWFKFTSFNTAQNSEQPLSAATAYSVVIAGTYQGVVDLSSLGSGLDAVHDGSTYARPVSTRLNAGRPLIDFSEAIHLNKVLDNIGDGATYARPLATRVNAGRPFIDFSETIHSNKNLDAIADGASRFGVINGGGLKAVASVDGANKALIDFSQGGHTNKTLDNVADGTRAAWDSAAMKTAAVDTAGNLKLKNVNDAPGTTSGPTTSSGTYAVIPEMTQTITFKGNKVLLLFTMSVGNSGTTANFAFFKDGVQLSQDYSSAPGAAGANAVANSVIFSSFAFIDSPSAASHTYDVRWKTAGGISVSAVGTARRFQIVELG